MVVYFVRCRVKPGCEEAFVEASVENAKASGKEAGIVRFDLLRDGADPSRFVLVEAYRDEAAPKLHKETAHYARWRDAVEPLLAEPRSKESFEGVFVPERRL
jgi:(4S)-4-hydroxy-5-phosphonooxypentane-2,3-dione isomerase